MLAILAAVVVGLCLAAVTTPPLFNALLRLGRNVEGLAFLRQLEFERLFNRTCMLWILLGLWPALRWSGFWGRAALGLPRLADPARRVGRGLLYGVAVLMLYIAGGLLLGAYAIDADHPATLMSRLAAGLLTGLLIGFAEELFFRGVLFGGLRPVLGFWGATLASSVVYSLAHFIKPTPPLGTVYGHADSGWSLMYHAFGAMSWNQATAVLTLLALGVVFCLLYDRSGSLYLPIGVHAGLVAAVQTLPAWVERQELAWVFLFGRGGSVVKSTLALALAIAMALALALIPRPGGRRAAG
jgi:membrane protease YdiL (CAAX protease family)